MSDDQKLLYVRRLRQAGAGRGQALSARQACINRWCGQGLTLEAARERWRQLGGSEED